MKTKIFLLTAIIITMFGVNSAAQNKSAQKKVLIAYFSRSGNTRTLANQIKDITNGDIFEIQMSKGYPEEYSACTEVAKRDKETNARPELKAKVHNLDTYDVVFIGYPNWWGTAPMIIWTFMESHNLSGKTLIPFCTHGGGGEQNCFTDLADHAGKADILKGFTVSGSRAKSVKPQIESWLHEIGIVK